MTTDNTYFLSIQDEKINNMNTSLRNNEDKNNFGYLMLDTQDEQETPDTIFSTSTPLHRAV